MGKKLVIMCLLLAGFAVAAERAKNVYKTHKLSEYVVGISCDNGGDPTVVNNVNGVLIVSCGR